MKICVPSMNPGGLNALVSVHFGHCEIFTIVTIEGNEIKSVETIANDIEHDCMIPVNELSKAKVNILLIGSIGRNPLLGLQQNGIQVYIGATGTVKDAVDDFLNEYFRLATINDVCTGFCH